MPVCICCLQKPQTRSCKSVNVAALTFRRTAHKFRFEGKTVTRSTMRRQAPIELPLRRQVDGAVFFFAFLVFGTSTSMPGLAGPILAGLLGPMDVVAELPPFAGPSSVPFLGPALGPAAV